MGSPGRHCPWVSPLTEVTLAMAIHMVLVQLWQVIISDLAYCPPPPCLFFISHGISYLNHYFTL